ncbi:MAG: DUF3426 domain-containing protein [Candidatus Binatia bacterium]
MVANTAPDPPPPAAEPRKPPARRAVESLSFAFSTSGDEPDFSDEPAEPAAPKRALGGARRDREPDFSFDLDDDADLEVAASRSRPDRDEPRFVRGEDELRIEETAPGRNPANAYFLFLSVLIISYGIFALDLRNHPDRTVQLLASVPLVGQVLAEDRLLLTRVQLEDVEGVYQQIKDDRPVFIISGRAVNGAGQSLKGVQIESSLFDGNGQALESKSIYCGNAMSLKIVKDLSTKEISLLQRLEPPKRFEIRPGEGAGFSVVFLNPPAGVKEFSARVAAAQPAGA